MKKIALVGYRCTGKSSIGKELSALLGATFYDTDLLITAKEGRSVADIVESDGWQRFRELEEKAIKTLASDADTVVALGGGALDSAKNRRILIDKGFLFVWLKADTETILSRLDNDTRTDSLRPALLDCERSVEIQRMLAAREPIYRELADYIVDTTHKSIDSIAKELYHRFR